MFSCVNLENLVFNIHHDEDCEVYINGVLAASVTGWSTGYVILPINSMGLAALKSNSMNLIAIHCKQTGGGQYIDAGISLYSYDQPAPEIPKYTTVNDQLNGGRNFLFPGLADEFVQFYKPFTNQVTGSIINTNGVEVKKLSGNLGHINVSQLPAGFYLLKVTDKSDVQNFRFIKK